MFKSIRWQLSLSYAAIALLAALALGAVLVSILLSYYSQLEVAYLRGNAKASGQCRQVHTAGRYGGVGPQVDGAYAELWVADSGIGIPAEDLPQLFHRFHRGRNTTGYPGNGLGLAIVRAIAQSHGGSVCAANTQAGARFVVRLPLSPRADGLMPEPHGS